MARRLGDNFDSDINMPEPTVPPLAKATQRQYVFRTCGGFYQEATNADQT